jgi:hypothetical protein
MQNDSGASLAEAIYRKMSDEELQNTLRCETFSDGALDVKQIEMILAEMERRGINDPSRSSEEAWNEFEQEYSGKISDYADCAPDTKACAATSGKPMHTHRCRPVRKLTILAATLVFLIASLLTVQASGVDVFGAIVRWTDELFSFGKTEENRGLVVDGKWPEIDLNKNQQFTSLQEALDFYGVTEVFEPRWIPDEFVQEIVTVDTNGVWLSFFIGYANSSGQILAVSYNSYQSASLMYYEKTGSLLETFVSDGVMYNIFRNVDNYTAAWITPHFECCISVPTDAMDIDELKNILSAVK